MVIVKRLDNPALQRDIVLRIERLHGGLSAKWGLMDAEQMLRHLVGAFQMAMKKHEASRRPSLLRGPVGRFVVLYLPVPWIKGYPSVRELDIVKIGAKAGDFDQSREELCMLIDRFCLSTAEQLLPEHPILGRMSHSEWMRWGYLHTDHHLRQFGC
jgi:hypothetical protein